VRPPKDQRKRSEYYAKLFGKSDDNGSRQPYYGTTTTLEVVGRPRAARMNQIQVNVTVDAPKSEPKEPRRRLQTDRKDFLLKMIQKTSSRPSSSHTVTSEGTPHADIDKVEPTEATGEPVDAEFDELAGLDQGDIDYVPDDLPDDL
jgi:hypothetical protein